MDRSEEFKGIVKKREQELGRKLTDDEILDLPLPSESEIPFERLVAFIRKTWGNGRKCPMCLADDWALSDQAYELREYRSGGLVLGSPIVPVVPITCNNCGNTVLINALVAKVIDG